MSHRLRMNRGSTKSNNRAVLQPCATSQHQLPRLHIADCRVGGSAHVLTRMAAILTTIARFYLRDPSKPSTRWRRRVIFPVAYSIAPYASVQKSVNTFGGSGESIMRCVKRMPIIPSAGSVYADVPKPPSQPNRPGVRKISLR